MSAQPATSSFTWVEEYFGEIERSVNGQATSAVHQLRKQALARFTQLGFPNTKMEEWKYTSVAPIARTAFHRAPTDASVAADWLERFGADVQGPRAVFIDGRFRPELSSVADLPQGIRMRSIAEVLSDENGSDKALLEQHVGRYAVFSEQAFVALNTAFLEDGLFLAVEEGAIVEQPLQAFFLSSAASEDAATFPRVFIHAAKNSKATLIESYGSFADARHFTTAVAEVVVEAAASFDHYKVQLENQNALHVSQTDILQGEKSWYANNSFSFGGSLVRNDINPTLDGEEIETTLNGLSVLSGDQHVDNHTVIDHAKPHCLSNELYKGIYGDKSRGVFNGTIIVRKDAQKTNAIQSNQALLLSEDAEINSKPQLKIWADDVRCTHGATVGQLDDQALFYLRSRGIPQQKARDILIHGFAEDIINQVRPEPLREMLEERLLEKLEKV